MKTSQQILSTGLILSLVMFVFGCQAAAPVEINRSPRTTYEALALETPETAVLTFCKAFQQSDFDTLYLTLAPETQRRLAGTTFDLFDHNFVFNLPDQEREVVFRAWTDKLRLLDQPEQFYDTRYGFNTLMLTFEEYGLLPVKLPQEIAFLDSHPAQALDAKPAVDVTIGSENTNESLVFRMVQSPAGKWRVQQIIESGGDTSRYPWSVRIKDNSLRQAPIHMDPPQTDYTQLDLSTPETTVQTFSEAFQNQNFPTVFWMLHAEAQLHWWNNFRFSYYDKLVDLDNAEQLFLATDFGKRLLDLEQAGVIDKGEGLSIFQLDHTLLKSPYMPLVMEQIGDNRYLFDQIMLAAAGNYLIDLTEPLEILDTYMADAGGIYVKAERTSDNQIILFHLKQAISGRWRIFQVQIPGGPEEVLPWSSPR